MQKICISQPQDSSFLSQLRTLYETFKNISLQNQQVVFDISDIRWARPLLVLPLSSYISETNSSWEKPVSDNVASYLETIQFPSGVDSMPELTHFFQAQKTYIPISVLKREKKKEREQLESLFLQMLYKILKPTAGAKDSLYYPISELVTNIFEHSTAERGYIFGQHYQAKQYLDICIVDRGRGLAKGYKEEVGLSFSDEEAIREALKGRSVKSSERGFGLRTSKRIVCEALKGEFVLISGSAALISAEKEQITMLPNFYWNGVIIAFRIKPPKMPVDITPYTE